MIIYTRADGTKVPCTVITRGRTQSLIVAHGRAYEKTAVWVDNEYLTYVEV